MEIKRTKDTIKISLEKLIRLSKGVHTANVNVSIGKSLFEDENGEKFSLYVRNGYIKKKYLNKPLGDVGVNLYQAINIIYKANN